MLASRADSRIAQVLLQLGNDECDVVLRGPIPKGFHSFEDATGHVKNATRTCGRGDPCNPIRAEHFALGASCFGQAIGEKEDTVSPMDRLRVFRSITQAVFLHTDQQVLALQHRNLPFADQKRTGMPRSTIGHETLRQIKPCSKKAELQIRVTKMFQDESIQTPDNLHRPQSVQRQMPHFAADSCREQSWPDAMTRHVAQRYVAARIVGKQHLAVITTHPFHRDIARVDFDLSTSNRPWQQAFVHARCDPGLSFPRLLATLQLMPQIRQFCFKLSLET